ncbi:MAG: hypothetical protein GY791_16780 [Alphaproteobacteria bacterium]|nr:hypothetical protein [Alphaproteobacteria bacterium]
MRLFAVLTVPVMLAGCGVPLGISAASYVADGLSAGASGKSVNDHMLSQAVNMDCGLLRFFDGEWFCRDRGIDPDDDTIYLADGRRHEGPPRPWGTIREPNLDYDDGLDHDAREWASGADLAFVDVGDDSSGEFMTEQHSSPGSYVGPEEIGDLSERREHEEKLAAVAERIQFAQALELQYQQMIEVQTTTIAPAAYIPAAEPQPQPRREPAQVVFVDNLKFAGSLGMQESYETAEATKVAALTPIPGTANPARSEDSRPLMANIQLASARSGNAIGAAGYGSGAEPAVVRSTPGPDKILVAQTVPAGQVAVATAASANTAGPDSYGHGPASPITTAAVIDSVTGTQDRASSVPARTLRQPAESQPGLIAAVPTAPKVTPRVAPRDWRLAAESVAYVEPSQSLAETGGSYLVVGSFGSQANARAAVSRFDGADLTMVESMVDGRIFYRLVAGPYAETQLPVAKANLRIAGLSESWKISPCGPAATNGDGCLSESQVAKLHDADPHPRSMQLAGIRN